MSQTVSWPYIGTSEARGVLIMHASIDGEREMDVGISHGALLSERHAGQQGMVVSTLLGCFGQAQSFIILTVSSTLNPPPPAPPLGCGSITTQYCHSSFIGLSPLLSPVIPHPSTVTG